MWGSVFDSSSNQFKWQKINQQEQTNKNSGHIPWIQKYVEQNMAIHSPMWTISAPVCQYQTAYTSSYANNLSQK